MPSMAFIEDDHMRFTVLSGQPSGVASLQSGEKTLICVVINCIESFYSLTGAIEVFLDRRLQRDDNRGLGQGVTDNREILSRFKLIVEPRRTVCVNRDLIDRLFENN